MTAMDYFASDKKTVAQSKCYKIRTFPDYLAVSTPTENENKARAHNTLQACFARHGMRSAGGSDGCLAD